MERSKRRHKQLHATPSNLFLDGQTGRVAQQLNVHQVVVTEKHFTEGAVADNPRDRYLQGERLSGRLIFAPSPDLLFSFTVEANTLDPTATTQFLASWRLRGLTNLSLLLNLAGPGVDVWVDEPAQQALVKLSVGLTPF